jgi:hypothetical protein
MSELETSISFFAKLLLTFPPKLFTLDNSMVRDGVLSASSAI